MAEIMDKEILTHRDIIYQDNVSRSNRNSRKRYIKNNSEKGNFRNICSWRKDGSCKNDTRYKLEEDGKYKYFCKECLADEELAI